MVVCELLSFAQECDIPNWFALVIEIAIGGALATIFFIRQQKQGNRLQKVIYESEQFRKRRHDFSVNIMRSYLPEIHGLIDSIEEHKQVLKNNVTDNRAKELINMNLNYLKQNLKNITYQLTFSADVLEPHHVEAIRHLLEITDQYAKLPLDFDAKHHVPGIKANLDALLKELPNPMV